MKMQPAEIQKGTASLQPREQRSLTKEVVAEPNAVGGQVRSGLWIEHLGSHW